MDGDMECCMDQSSRLNDCGSKFNVKNRYLSGSNEANNLRQPLLVEPPSSRFEHYKSSISLFETVAAQEIMFKSRNGKKQQSNLHRSEIDKSQAWLTLACVFIINSNTLGSLKIYGLIFEEIVAQKFYNREEASWPISTASTVQNLAGLLTPLLAMKISWKSIELIQTFLFVSANLGAYFSGSLALDIFFLGIVQGIAFSLRYNMNVVINNEYFIKYRATAMGVSLAGSTCGVFILKPIIAYVLDTSNHKFRNAYLTLGAIMSFNIILNLLIRKPKSPNRPDSPDSQVPFSSISMEEDEHDDSILSSLIVLVKNPSIHCIWIMQTVYFYISRTYTIFIVDYGVDKGFSREDSRNMLDFWVYGEVVGRLLLGALVDARLLSLKWNIVIVNLLLALSGFALLFVNPISFASQDQNITNVVPNVDLVSTSQATIGTGYFWFFGISVSLIAALSSLVNMLIVPFGQEYLGKKNVPWAFAIGSVVTSFFLLLRPSLIGLSRDYYKSYDLLILVMSSGPSVYALLFMIIEPFLRKFTHIAPPITD